MAITFFGSAAVPTDNSTNTATTNAITPPANMLEGDLVVVYMQQRGTADMSVFNDAGQRWYDHFDKQTNTSTISTKVFWCRYNGTWSVNPEFQFSAGTCTTVVMLVFRPSATGMFWALDLEPSRGTFVAGSTPFTKTISAVTTTRPSSVSIAAWATADDNTWGSLSGTGWSKTSLSAQYRNTSGSDQSCTFAYNIKTSAGTTNSVSQNQATLGGDAGLTTMLTFYERNDDFIGDPTNWVSTFALGNRMLVHKTYCSRSGRSVRAKFRAWADSGTADIYVVVYKLNGGTHEFLKVSSPVTVGTTQQWNSVELNYDFVAGTMYEIGFFSLSPVTFNYINNPNWVTGESWDAYVGGGSVPSFGNIAVGAETTNYVTHQAIEISFGGPLAGVLTGSSSTVATIKGRGELQGKLYGSSSTIADLTGTSSITYADFVGDVSGSSYLSAVLTGTANMQGSVTGRAEVNATISGKASLAAEINGRAYTNALLTGYIQAAGSLFGSSSVSSDIRGVSAISGSLYGRSEISAQIKGLASLAAALSGRAEVNGSIKGLGSISGSIYGNSTVAGSLQGFIAMEGSLHGSSNLTASIKGLAIFYGQASGDSQLNGVLTASGALQGTLYGSSWAGAYFLPEGGLNGRLYGSSSMTGILTGKASLEGSLYGNSSLSAIMAAKVQLAGELSGNSSISGSMSAYLGFQGGLQGSSNVSGTMQGQGSLSGSIYGNSSVSGRLSGSGSLQGTLYGYSYISGEIRDYLITDYTVLIRQSGPSETKLIHKSTVSETKLIRYTTVSTTSLTRKPAAGETVIILKPR